MNIIVVSRVVSAILMVIGIAMLTSVPVSWAMKDPSTVITGLFQSSLLPIVVGGIGILVLPKQTKIRFKEGFGIVAFSC